MIFLHLKFAMLTYKMLLLRPHIFELTNATLYSVPMLEQTIWTNFRKHYTWMRPPKFQHFTPLPRLWKCLILHCVPTLAADFIFVNVIILIALALLRHACFRDINTPNVFYIFAIAF